MNGTNVKTLPEFLKFHRIRKDSNDNQVITHTRIGDPSAKSGKKIWGGSYHIPDEELGKFWKLYYKWVFEKKNHEYLTETQDKINGGPLLIDIDMRFTEDVKERQFTIDEISAILELYSESLIEILRLDEDIEFQVFIFEKNSVVTQKGKETKDGIHIIFGLNMKHNIQLLLRKIVVDKEKNEMGIFGENGLNCVNKVEDIFDECISSGRNNWQVCGSHKPGCEAYELKYYWKITIKDGEYFINMEDIDSLNIQKILPEISAKNKNFPKLTSNKIKEKYSNQLEKFLGNKKKIQKDKIRKNKKIKMNNSNIFGGWPKNEIELDDVILDIFNNLGLRDYHLKELHEFTMLLDENYFTPFKDWMNVGLALHNTDNNLFWTWVKFSCKSSKFNWLEVPNMYKVWGEMKEKEEGLTFRSIHYWAKNLNPTQYKKIHDSSVEQLVYKTLPGGGTDTDIAILAKNLFMGEFACVSMVEKKWFQFIKHRWKNSDAGIGLRIKLSQDIETLYQQAAQNEKDKSTDEQWSAAEREAFLQNASAFNRITMKLKSHTAKKSIMGECQEQFYNEELRHKMDENKYLMGFENGVYDFRNKEFRTGIPEDYVSFTTKTNYVSFDEDNEEHVNKWDELCKILIQIFPNKQLREYMLDHAASTLIGENKNQKFILYTGVGGNGKSIWVDLLNLVLGDYADKINIALLTQKRKSIGGPSPEIAKLKGKRFVSMDEPTVGDELNEGIMKQMTGGDEMEGRAMYAKSMCKFVPQFELVCCTNHLFNIKSTDKGTWRRIRQVPFNAEFVDETDYEIKRKQGLLDDTEKPVYMKDLDMKEKLPGWVEVFTAKLIERVNETAGVVKDCPLVLEASKKYEERENFWRQFMNDNIAKGTENDKIKKTEIRNIFNEWYQTNYQQRPPKATELYEQLDKNIGRQRNKAWYGWKIIYGDYDSEEDSSDSN
jgi:P4 family phage/plasmid primase-like protien